MVRPTLRPDTSGPLQVELIGVPSCRLKQVGSLGVEDLGRPAATLTTLT